MGFSFLIMMDFEFCQDLGAKVLIVTGVSLLLDHFSEES